MSKESVKGLISVTRWISGSALLVLAWGLSVVGVSNASGNYRSNGSSAEAQLYAEECGACHLAYPSRMLPQQSWSVMMSRLDRHFEENAELPEEVATQIREYLLDNAGKPGRGMLKRMAGTAPQRISELPYFIRKHDEIPSRYVTGNDDVGSFSNCDACHKKAARGDFDEDRVRIPGYGRWDD